VLGKFNAAADYTVASDHRFLYIRCDDQASSSSHLRIDFLILCCEVTEEISTTHSTDISSIKCSCHCYSPQKLITTISNALWVFIVELGEVFCLQVSTSDNHTKNLNVHVIDCGGESACDVLDLWLDLHTIA
jgi:hypothetical protein